MKKILGICLFHILLHSCICNNEDKVKTIEEYRSEALMADKEALRLNNISNGIKEELVQMDSIYYLNGENPIYKIKIDSLQHILDSLDVLIEEQCIIMNKAQHDCDSIHNTWAL